MYSHQVSPAPIMILKVVKNRIVAVAHEAYQIEWKNVVTVEVTNEKHHTPTEEMNFNRSACKAERTNSLKH